MRVVMGNQRKRASLAFAVFAAGVVLAIAGCGGRESTAPSDGGAGTGGSAGGSGGSAASSGGAGGAIGGNGGSGQSGQGGAFDAGADARADAPTVAPTITMLTPSTLPRNAGTFTLYVDGMNFPPSPDLCFEGNCWTPTIISETRMSAEIPGPALGGMPREAWVRVYGNLPPYFESNTLYFTITAPP
jgi:hypothetical protein